jgi:hypothetical protein
MRLVDCKQSRLVRQELTNRDRFLATLGKLRPVGAHPFFIVEPAARMRERKRHCCRALGGGVHDDHGVLIPWLTRCLVAYSSPQVDDFLPAAIDAAGRTQLFPEGEVFGEGLADGFPSFADVATNFGVVGGSQSALAGGAWTVAGRGSR